MTAMTTTLRCDSATAVNLTLAREYVLAPEGKEIWRGSPADLAALVRDAKRFRKLERLTFGQSHMIGMSKDGYDKTLMWGEGRTLAEIADALPERTHEAHHNRQVR